MSTRAPVLQILWVLATALALVATLSAMLGRLEPDLSLIASAPLVVLLIRSALQSAEAKYQSRATSPGDAAPFPVVGHQSGDLSCGSDGAGGAGGSG